MVCPTSATSTNADIAPAILTSVTSNSETSRASDGFDGIGSTSSTISSATTTTAAAAAATTTAVAKPGFFGKVSAFACNIIDKICKAFEKCFASIKRLFGRPAATPTTVATASTISNEKRALRDLKAFLETDGVTDAAAIDAYTALLVKSEFGNDKLFRTLKEATYDLAKAENNCMEDENGFENPNWAGDAIKRDPTNKYVMQALTNMIESAE